MLVCCVLKLHFKKFAKMCTAFLHKTLRPLPLFFPMAHAKLIENQSPYQEIEMTAERNFIQHRQQPIFTYLWVSSDGRWATAQRIAQRSQLVSNNSKEALNVQATSCLHCNLENIGRKCQRNFTTLISSSKTSNYAFLKWAKKRFSKRSCWMNYYLFWCLNFFCFDSKIVKSKFRH